MFTRVVALHLTREFADRFPSRGGLNPSNVQIPPAQRHRYEIAQNLHVLHYELNLLFRFLMFPERLEHGNTMCYFFTDLK